MNQEQSALFVTGWDGDVCLFFVRVLAGSKQWRHKEWQDQQQSNSFHKVAQYKHASFDRADYKRPDINGDVRMYGEAHF